MKKINFTTIIAVTYILYIIIFVTLIFGIFYIKNNLNENKESFEKFKYDKLIVTNPIKINENELTEAKITVSKENIDILNAHLNYINSRNEEAIELSHKTIDNDIDRLNTFMAVGIGLLSLFGVVLPIATTFFQTESLKSKIVDIDNKLIKIDDIEEKMKKIDEIKIDAVSNKVKTIEEHIPTLHILTLQYYIGRLLNLDRNEIPNRNDYLQNVLSGIRQEFGFFNNSSFKRDQLFNSILDDFKNGIRFHLTSLSELSSSRTGQSSVNMLNTELDNLISGNGSIDNLITALDKFQIN